MGFESNELAFAHKDIRAFLTPREGRNAGKISTFNAAESAKGDPGKKAAALHGFKIGPLAVVPSKAEPTGELALTIAEEATRALTHIGANNQFDMDVVFTRKGKQTLAYKFTNCQCDGGGGFDSSGDAAPKDTFKWKAEDVLVKKGNGKYVSLINDEVA